MPKMGSGVRTSRGGKRAEQAKRLTDEVFAAAERYGLTEASEDLALLSAAAERAIAGGVSLDRLMQATEQGAERGESARRAARKAAPRKRSTGKREKAKPVEAAPVEARVEPVSEPEPAPAVAAKKLMVSSPFYPEQPCGLSYKDFRVGHTYKDAYHWLMTAQSEDSYRTITQRAVLRQLAKMKRATFEAYLSDCAAMEQYEQDQRYGGREGDYSLDESVVYDTSFDPSEFAPAEPDDFIAFNPRRRRTSRRAMSVEEVWHRLGSPRVDLGELATGIRVEAEHGVGPVKAGRIALDHLREFPDYYTRLVKMEERAKRGLAPNSTGLTVEQVPGRHDGLGTSGPYKLFVAILDGKKAGSLWFSWNHETQDMAVVSVSQVHVEPFARRRGVSTALHSAAAAWLRSKGDFRLGSGMVTSEENAAYWKKLEAKGEARRYGSDEWQMVRNPKIVSLGPNAYFAAAGLAMNARRTSRRPRKATSRKS